jgi:hypothetical protein
MTLTIPRCHIDAAAARQRNEPDPTSFAFGVKVYSLRLDIPGHVKRLVARGSHARLQVR